MPSLQVGDVIHRNTHRFSSGHEDGRYFFVAGIQTIVSSSETRYILLTCTTSETKFPEAKRSSGCHRSEEHNYACFFCEASDGRFRRDTYLDLTTMDSSTVFQVSILDEELKSGRTTKEFVIPFEESLPILRCASESRYLPGWALKGVRGLIEYAKEFQSFP